jgi:thioredoxin 1
MEKVFTDQNFDQEVLKSEKPVLVDFWAPWCGPCLAMAPIIDELAKEFEDKAIVGKINVDENVDTAQKYGIMSIPFLKIFKGGKIVKEFTGMQSKETLAEELKKI